MEHKRTTPILNHERFVIDQLARMRDVRDWTTTELARRAQMDASHLGKAFRGERGLRADEFLRLCAALDFMKMGPFIPKGVMRDIEALRTLTRDGEPIL